MEANCLKLKFTKLDFHLELDFSKLKFQKGLHNKITLGKNFFITSFAKTEYLAQKRHSYAFTLIYSRVELEICV